ncbi:hypothetical protein J2W37_001263 [Variovorax paradoxus]|nr:hypothetical protein [Variovorax paradoxus]
MTEPILKRALAKPPAADRDATPGLGMLTYGPGYQPKKPPVRRAPGQRVDRSGGVP